MTGALAGDAAVHAALLGVLIAFLIALLLVWRRRSSRRGTAARDCALTATSPSGTVLSGTAALSGEEVMRRVRAAESSGASEELPALYLLLAKGRLAEGAAGEAEDLLRKSLRGAGPRFKDVQAQARVMLGDMAYAEGDLSTACEHWQIARALFFELKRSGEHAAVESRMLKNGCPTDWVLTDF